MLTRGHDHQLRGKTVRGSVLPGRGGGGGGSKRWLNTGRHLLTVALSSSLHWFPVKCIAETRRSAPKRHKHELIFEGIEGRILVRDTIDARTCRDAGSRKCVVSVVIVVCYFCRNRRRTINVSTSVPGWRRRQWRKAHEAKLSGERSWWRLDSVSNIIRSRSPAKISNPGAIIFDYLDTTWKIMGIFGLDRQSRCSDPDKEWLDEWWIEGILLERTIMIILITSDHSCKYSRGKLSLLDDWTLISNFQQQGSYFVSAFLSFFFFPPQRHGWNWKRDIVEKKTWFEAFTKREDNSFRECVRWRKPIEGWTIGTRRNVKERETRVSNCFAALHDVVLNDDEAGC